MNEAETRADTLTRLRAGALSHPLPHSPSKTGVNALTPGEGWGEGGFDHEGGIERDDTVELGGRAIPVIHAA